jgi:hypothetical protein
MNTLYSCAVERRDFGNLLSAEGVARLDLARTWDPEALVAGLSPRDQSVVAVWSQDPTSEGQLPDLLVCQDGTEGDWAAWITTFGAKIRPFSAFMRLIARSLLENLAGDPQSPALGRLTWPVAGLILGEVLAASGLPDRSLETMPANACESTLSFAMFRARAAHPRFRQWRQLADQWESVRQATRQHPRLIESAAVARVCATILEAVVSPGAHSLLGAGDSDVVDVCREVIKSPETAPRSLSVILQFASVEKRMGGPREDRVVAFSEFVRAVEGSPSTDTELTSFMLGYLASRIAPGTIQHSSILRPVMHRFATALLWYGFCAGLGRPEASLRNVSGQRWPTLDLPASARRVARDLIRPEPIFAPPACDIAFHELLALSRTGGDPLVSLIRTTQGTATVELVPGVWTVVNVSPKSGPDDSLRPERERDILASMGEYIDRLSGAYNDLVRHEIGETKQRPLFPPKRKKH